MGLELLPARGAGRSISADLGLSREWFFGIFSGALLLSGLLGPAAGRAIDRRGGRDVLALSNLVFATGLLLLAAATGIAGLASAWFVLGIGMGLGLYDAAFATLAGLYRAEARGAITGITLLAGFASTVGWPATALLTDELGWRGLCVVWAALHLVLGLPLNRLLVPSAPPPEKLPASATTGNPPPWSMIVSIRRAPRCSLQPTGEEFRRPDEPEGRRFWPNSTAAGHRGAGLDSQRCGPARRPAMLVGQHRSSWP